MKNNQHVLKNVCLLKKTPLQSIFVFLFFLLMTSPVFGATNQSNLAVSCSASPSQLTSGQHGEVIVLVTLNGNPVSNAQVTLSSSFVQMSPATGITDSSGIFRSTVYAPSGLAGTDRLIAQATYSSGSMAANVGTMTGSGTVEIPVQLSGSISPSVTPTDTPAQGNKPPIVIATANLLSGNAPLTVAFDASGSYDPDGSVVAYSWNFADGQTATGKSVTHTFTNPGTYSSMVTVTDSRGFSSSPVYLEIVAKRPEFVDKPITVDPKKAVPDRSLDTDQDGVFNSNDNCPLVSNPDQKDSEESKTCIHSLDPNTCGLSPDPDGIGDACDNCWYIHNTTQSDVDGDCEEIKKDPTYWDGQRWIKDPHCGDPCDNCQNVKNPDQKDSDLDGIGDECDNCPSLKNPTQWDFDHDNIGDNCDNCPQVQNPTQTNTDNEFGDGDSHGDACDNCPATKNEDQRDWDADGIGDTCDTKVSQKLDKSVYLDYSDGKENVNDRDHDHLDDSLEGVLADSFSPYVKFDSDEKSRRWFEPVILFQARPLDCTGTRCSENNQPEGKIRITYGFLYLNDGGYGPNSDCGWAFGSGNEHLGDNQAIDITLESKDKGVTWDLVDHGRLKKFDYSLKDIEFHGKHPVLYLSAHKHHEYFNTGWDHHDSISGSSIAGITCNDDVNGMGAQFQVDLSYLVPNHRWSNVGEPGEGNHSSEYFISCLPQFPSILNVTMCKEVDCKNSLSWGEYITLQESGKLQFQGDSECNGEYYSAWGTAGFYKETPIGDMWSKESFYFVGDVKNENIGIPFIENIITTISEFFSHLF